MVVVMMNFLISDLPAPANFACSCLSCPFCSVARLLSWPSAFQTKQKPQPYETCKDNHFCMILTSAELDALPTLTVYLDGGVKVDVRPEGYMDSLGKDNAYAPR